MRLLFPLLFFVCGYCFGQEHSPGDSTTQKVVLKSDVSKKSNELAQRENPSEELNNLDTSDATVNLNEVLLVSRFKFSSREERRRYLILRKKTRKVWPYAVLASQRLSELSERLKKIERGYEKSRYIKIVQRYIEKEFKEELKKLTKTEGQILVKLMYRQTGKTTFDIIKNLRSGWRAFWYNTTASLFNISLKEKYNPDQVKEDYMIEHILRRSFQSGKLERQPAAFPIKFADLMD